MARTNYSASTWYSRQTITNVLDFMCLIFTADATVRAGKGPGGSGDGTYTFQTLLRLESVLTTNSQILSDRFVIRAVHTSSEMYIV